METKPNLPMATNQNNGETSDLVISIPDADADSEWLASMEEKMETMTKMLNKSAGKITCSIFRVPKSLVEINEKAYQPHIVSIGPYHHGKEHLKMIEGHKWRLLAAVLARIQQHGVSLNDLFKAIASKEEEIRECYSETVEYSSHELIQMMVVDGCFVIELFCIVGRLVEIDLDDPIFNIAWIISFLMRDLLQLENQIPFFVLQTLYELSILASKKGNLPSLTELALVFFDYAAQRPDEVLGRFRNLTGKHLLDIFRLTFVPSTEEQTRKPNPCLQLIQSAKKLHLAGIRFRRRETDSFLDVAYKNGVLEIPLLTIDDFRSSMLLNFVAFEQCYSHCSKHVTSYVTFMGCLINTPIDAGFLSDHKIIENYLGTDDQVAKFFNDVGKDVAFDIQRTYLLNVFEDVNEYYRKNRHVKWAWTSFKHTYLDTPWTFMSALVAVFLLIITVIQFYFAINAFVRPPN